MNQSPTNMPIAPSATVRHTIAFRRCKPFPLEAKVRVISTHNPWRPNAIAWNLFEKVLRVKTETTIKDILDDAEAIGYFRTDAARYLRWLFTWGDFIEVDGNRYFPEVEVAPTLIPEPPPEPVRPPVRVAASKKSKKSQSRQRKGA